MSFCQKCDAEWLPASVNGEIGPCPFCVAADLKSRLALAERVVEALGPYPCWWCATKIGEERTPWRDSVTGAMHVSRCAQCDPLRAALAEWREGRP